MESTTRPTATARAQHAWCLYDWANSAFATSVVAAILPVLFARTAGRHMPAHQATALWGYVSAGTLAIAALFSPLVGALADQTGRRRRILAVCIGVGSLATLELALVPAGDWRPIVPAFAVAFIAFMLGNVLYDALLPAVAAPDEMDRVSARGFAYGYLGGGLLLAVNLVMVTMPRVFGLPDAATATRAAFASVAVWWLAFSFPLFRDVPEPAAERTGEPGESLARAVFARLRHTFAELGQHPDRLRFLIAFWLYSDGIGTIIKMATVYGVEVGLGDRDLLGALLMVQLLAAPAALAFGRIARPLGARGAVLLGLAGYTGITVFASFLHTAWQFWVLAGLVALFQGGTQALSRSLFASLVPPARSGELFGFYAVSEKMAGVAGPLLFGLVTQWAHGGRMATLTLLPLFLSGAWLFTTVDFARGQRAAQAEAGTASH